MRQVNFKFANLVIGSTVEVRPCMYDRDWTPAIVEKITYTDFPIKNDPCTTLVRRYALFARIVDRTDYCPLILREEDVRFN